MQTGKVWFYSQLEALVVEKKRRGRNALGIEKTSVEKRSGRETKALRDKLGLKKTQKKLAEVFEAHCVDSWVLANSLTGGHKKPDNTELLIVNPLRFHRRQLHKLKPAAGGLRKRVGGTRSHGFKRGSLVRHTKLGVVYVGGFSKDRISLHSLETGKRLTHKAKPNDCRFLCFNSWRSTTTGSGLSSAA